MKKNQIKTTLLIFSLLLILLYSKFEYSHGQPGPFTLFHDADDPDPDGNFALNWTLSSGAWFYEAYRSPSLITDLNGSQTLLATNLTLGGYNVLGTPEGSFYFVIAAKNGTGYTLSNNVLINVTFIPPGPFTLFHDADNPDLDGNFILNWTPSSGAWFYEAYRSPSMITELNGSQTLLATNLTLGGHDVLETPEGSFYFAVAARNGTGYTLSNNVLINVTLIPPGPFTLFHNADNPDLDGNFILNWTPSSGAWFYEAYRSPSMITELNGTQTLLATNLTLGGYNVYGTPEGSYYFVVAAKNGKG
jgi:hypothetical protein